MTIIIQSWKIPDDFWEEIKDIIPSEPPDTNRRYIRKPGAGRPPANKRKVLEAIFYKVNTGTPWKDLPARFPASSSVHRYFLIWQQQGLFQKLYNMKPYKYKLLFDIEWQKLGIDIHHKNE